MSNHLDNLPDFLTLYSKDSLNPAPATLEYTWNLPDSYYSNQRATSAYVSIVDSFQENIALVAPQTAYVICMKEGASNYFSTDNRGIILGGVSRQAWSVAAPTDIFEFQKTGAMLQPLIAARPQKLTLCIETLFGTVPRPPGSDFDWAITLRFDYVNQERQAEGMLSSFTNNLLPSK